LNRRGRRVFNTLNGLCGLAALAVVTRHVPDTTFRDLLPGSTLAVDLFFVLSGFILAHSYTERLRGEMGAMAFMRIRIIRLYPLYILGTALVMAHFALSAGFNYRAWLHIIGSAVFAVLFPPTPPGISPDWHPFPLNFPAWSLFFELVINYVFALLLPRLTNRLLAGVIRIGLSILIATGLYFGDLTPGWSFSNFWGGGAASSIRFSLELRPTVSGGGAISIGSKSPAPVVLIILVAVFAAEPINGRAIYDLSAAITVFPILVLAAARKEPAGFFIRICEHLGRASYAIYVMQVSVIVWSRTTSKRLLGYQLTDLGVAGTIVVLVALTALALFLDKYYDQTARARMSRLFRRKQLTSNRNI
jgi:peptidoglycan/LPS O-acetylase OafA/YrhL